MNCPGCGCDNIQGMFACEECGMDLAGLDIPGGGPMEGLHRHIMRDPIRRLAPLKPLIATPATTIWECIRIMREGRHGSVLVVERSAGEHLVGIFTERDVLNRVAGRRLDLERVPVSRVMTRDPKTLREDDTLAFALHRMAVGSYRHIPILSDGRPPAFISVRGNHSCVRDVCQGDRA